MKVQCPAKVNLFLDVTGRRADGYHTLATIFAKLNLYDVLDLQITNSGRPELEIETDPDGPELAAGDDNLVLRAARAFYRAFGVGTGVKLVLTKRIPIGAGLGGGSSDAAGTLLGLARLFKIELGAKEKGRLRKIAAGLGADVPFFLHPSAVCLGRGVGDRLSPVPLGKSLPYMVLVYPNLHVSTAQAYAHLEKPARTDVLTRLSELDKLLLGLRKGRPIEEWQGLLFNRLEQARLPELATVEQARRILEKSGAAGVRMSGSGSSVFGFVPSHKEGEACLRRLQAYPWKVFLTSIQG